MIKSYYKELVSELKKRKLSKKQLNILKIKLCKKHKVKKIPTDIEILLNANVKDVSRIKRNIITKPTRTISGVSVCAVMTKPYSCPHVKKGVGPCLMCPGGPDSVFGNVPQSYTGKEPATRRAIRNKYDSYLQVMNRLEQHVVLGHLPDKLELIIMGGTFPSFPKNYQEEFVTSAFLAMNDFSSLFFNKKGELNLTKFKEFFELPGDIFDEKRTKRVHKKLLSIKYNKTIDFKSNKKIINNKVKKRNKEKTILAKEHFRNEKSNIRCISLVIETRPDYATLKHANEMLRLGCTKVELGVQTVYDDVLKKIRRGHTVQDSIESTKILKDLGFKINYHMMLGLPSVDKKRDFLSLAALFEFEEFQPDMLKLYPCMVLKGTKLYRLWKQKKYKPITTKQAAELIAEFKGLVPEWVRISRVQRDIPTFMTESGVDKTNLRQYVEELMKKKGLKCKCVRCRESGHVLRKNENINIKEIKILERHYISSGGNEFFISAEDVKNGILFGFCRLRFPSQSLRKEITEESALIRELHVYSPSVQIGKKSKSSYQHRGLGKELLRRAEETAKTYYKKKMVVISGVGARAYFAKLGYRKDGPYMSKII